MHSWNAGEGAQTSSRVVTGEFRLAAEPILAMTDLPAPDADVTTTLSQRPTITAPLAAGIEVELNVPSSAMNVPASDAREATGVPAMVMWFRPQTTSVWVEPLIAEWFSTVAAGQAAPGVPVATRTSVISNAKALIVSPGASAGAGLSELALSRLLLADTVTFQVPVRSADPAAVLARSWNEVLTLPGGMSSPEPLSLR